MPIVINTSEIKHGPAHYYTFLILVAGITAQPRNILSWSLPRVSQPSPGIIFLDLCRRYHGPAKEDGLSRRCGGHWRFSIQVGNLQISYATWKNMFLNRKSCLFIQCQASPALPQHHEVQDISADGRGVQGRTASIPSFFSPSRHSSLRNVSSSQIHSTWLGDKVNSGIRLS
jgi:hypothetical protein